jgi:DNA-binding response OmpR family regulator
MPGLNGRQLSERILAIRPDTRILFMSGHADDTLLRRGVETSDTHFIQKPFSMEGLVAKVSELLR